MANDLSEATLVARRLPAIGFVVALGVFATIGALEHTNARELDSAFGWVEHTHDVLDRIGSFDRHVIAAESARRGFALTHDESVLVGMNLSLAEAERALHELALLVADNADQKPKIERALSLFEKRRAMLVAAAAASHDGASVSIEERNALEGAAVTSMLGEETRSMAALERALLRERVARTEAHSERTLVTIVLGTALGAALLVGALLVLRNEARARDRAERARKRWDKVFEHAQWGIGTSDLEGRGIDLANPALLAMLNATPEALGARSLADWAIAEERPALFAAVARARHEGHVALESIFERTGGAPLPVAIDLSKSSADGGGLVLHVQDIEARKSLEKERDRLFELSGDIIAVVNMKGHFERVNPAFEKIMGYSPAEMANRSMLSIVHPDDLESATRASKSLRTGTGLTAFECRYLRKDGSPSWLQWTAVKDDSHDLIFAIARDVTDAKSDQARIEVLNGELAARVAAVTAINQELEAFSYSVSHDLRSPLRSIDGFGNALLQDYDGVLDATGKDYLRRVRAATQRMGQIIDDLLALSRITRTALLRTTVDVSALAAAINDELKAANAEREVEVTIASGLAIQADAKLVRIALENLLQNAWKFTSKRAQATIEVGGSNEEKTFFVRDNGAGFDMAYAEKLFGAFQRLHSAAEFAGSGIGLAIVQRIVNRHGGRLWAEAAPERGATFHLSF